MDIPEVVKQSLDLEDAIIRLCNEADDSNVVTNALLGAINSHAMSEHINPLRLVKMFALYTSCLSRDDIRQSIESFVIEYETKMGMSKRIPKRTIKKKRL